MKPLIALITLICGFANGQSTIEKASALLKEKKYAEAKKLLSPIQKADKSFADARYYLGRIAYAEDKLDDAEEFFEEAIGVNSKVAEYHFWLGNTWGRMAQDANMIKQGMLAPKIKVEFEKTVELDPTNTSAYHGLIGFYSQAPGFMGGSMEKAYECADKIKKLKFAEGCRAKANLYVGEKKIEDAEKEWKAAVKADESYFAGLILFYTNQKKFNSAFTALDESLKKNPDNMSVAYQYGRTSAISGERLQQGEDFLKKYLSYKPKETEPSHAGANMRLGQILEKKGNKTEAKKFFQSAVQQDPNLKEAKEGLERVSR
jgi:tetratricopeptide (TPR) repeat protein